MIDGTGPESTIQIWGKLPLYIEKNTAQNRRDHPALSTHRGKNVLKMPP